MNTVSMGVIIPVFPTLVKQLGHVGDARGAQVMGLFGATWAAMSLIFAPIFGNLSDRFGRRPVLLVSMFGLAFDYVIMAVAPNLAWLFIGRVISGVTASSGSAAGAYVADISTEDDRARNFGRFQAAANAGILLGPALGGFVGAWNPRAPFWVAAGLALANGLYGLFIVPESLSHERRAPFRWSRANPIGAAGLLMSKKGLLGLASIYFLAQLSNQTFSVFQFYTHFRYGWGPFQVGLLLMVLGAGGILVSSSIAGAAAKRLGERGAVLAGTSLALLGFVVAGLAANELWFWGSMLVFIVSGIAFPSLASLLSNRVGVDQQGQLQGAQSILFGLTGLVGPVIFSDIFAWSIGPGAGLHLPGLSMLAGGLVTLAGLTMAFIYARPNPPPTQRHDCA
ncbi:MAG TPA: MFS transporter [Caulobacteraceae bacterium]|jgi:DHA1 family tetracycline resistance protein-like MFS transporter|nr:MFS transporter [Caulobacteraceae bacterium]